MLERANDLIEKILDGTLKLIDDNGNIIGAQNIFTATSSNTYDGTNKKKGTFVTLEDENFRAADPSTGSGATH